MLHLATERIHVPHNSPLPARAGQTRTRVFYSLALSVPLALMCLAAEAAPRYTVTALDAAFEPADMNNQGQIAGWVHSPGGDRACLWQDGELTYLGALAPGMSSEAYGINDAGQVVGWGGYSTRTYGGSTYILEHAFLWDSVHGMQDLSTLGGDQSWAYGINNLGQVVGRAGSTTDYRAFLWSSVTGMSDIGPFHGPGGGAARVNNLGQVVWSTDDSAGTSCPHAVIWDNVNGMKYLGDLRGGLSRASSINDLGQVIGWTGSFDFTISGPFLWDSVNGMRPVESPTGSYSAVADVNNHGDIAGTAATTGGAMHAFLWKDGQTFDLNDLIPPGSGVLLNSAGGINDHGQIVAVTYPHEDLEPTLSFLLTPVPEPSPLAALALGLAGIGAAVRRRRAR